MLSLVGDYGSSSDEDDDHGLKGAVIPTTTDAGKQTTAPTRSANTADAYNPSPSTSARASVLPSASALLDNSMSGVRGVGSCLRSNARGGGHQRASQMTGSKRSASGQFPISDIAKKSGRAEQQKHVSTKPVNTLLPPQLRGRSNNATQDLEALGFKSRPKPSREA